MNFSYTYDNRGNITSETRNGSTTTYVYDGLGQLTRVNDPSEGGTWIYTYDRGGNLTNQSRYQYSTGALGTLYASYDCDYDDANWKDKITAQNNYPITYDAIGNPTNDSNWNYTWSAGRQLVKMSKTNHTINFKYNHNGLRTQKAVTINGVTTTTNYTYHDKLVTHMTRGNDILHFFYDASSKPAFVKFNGSMYRYVHNLQGDIVGIIDSNNAIVVEYKYSAWGKPYSITGSMASTLGAVNPFLYRGYVYDTETGFYYLRSRYFATIYPKFINADTLIHGNSFLYCNNNPITNKDTHGTDASPAVPHNTTDITLYIFTGRNYGHYVVETMGIAFSWEYANKGTLAIYSVEDLPAEMCNAGFDEDYTKIVFTAPYENVIAAIRTTYEKCKIKFEDYALPNTFEPVMGNRYTMYHEGARIKYDTFDFSCFAFADWFFEKAGISLSSSIGTITKSTDKGKQYLFAQEFHKKYPQYKNKETYINLF